jgi:hypothetical protein
MYFKVIEKNTEAWEKISAFMEHKNKVQAENLKNAALYIGFEFESYLRNKSLLNLCGDIVAVKPTSEDLSKNKDWKRDNLYPDFFRPNSKTKRGKQIESFLSSQQTVSFAEENRVFEVDSPHMWVSFGLFCFNDAILINTQDKIKFRVLDGMIEIMYSEFEKITKENESGIN